MSAGVEALAWDSEHFGESIARAMVHRLEAEAQLAQIIAWCRDREIACVYFLSDEDTHTRMLLERAGFSHVDTRVTLVSDTLSATAPDGRLRLARDEDLEALEAIARRSHHDSRFYQDARFERARCDALYATWISRSVSGWAAQVWVCAPAGDVVGYISCHHAAPTQAASIGLLALDASARGQGLGRALIEAALTGAVEAGMTHASVVTQARNRAALRAYERAGFHVAKTQHWYH